MPLKFYPLKECAFYTKCWYQMSMTISAFTKMSAKIKLTLRIDVRNVGRRNIRNKITRRSSHHSNMSVSCASPYIEPHLYSKTYS